MIKTMYHVVLICFIIQVLFMLCLKIVK